MSAQSGQIEVDIFSKHLPSRQNVCGLVVDLFGGATKHAERPVDIAAPCEPGQLAKDTKGFGGPMLTGLETDCIRGLYPLIIAQKQLTSG